MERGREKGEEQFWPGPCLESGLDTPGDGKAGGGQTYLSLSPIQKFEEAGLTFECWKTRAYLRNLSVGGLLGILQHGCPEILAEQEAKQVPLLDSRCKREPERQDNKLKVMVSHSKA